MKQRIPKIVAVIVILCILDLLFWFTADYAASRPQVNDVDYLPAVGNPITFIIEEENPSSEAAFLDYQREQNSSQNYEQIRFETSKERGENVKIISPRSY